MSARCVWQSMSPAAPSFSRGRSPSRRRERTNSHPSLQASCHAPRAFDCQNATRVYIDKFSGTYHSNLHRRSSLLGWGKRYGSEQQQNNTWESLEHGFPFAVRDAPLTTDIFSGRACASYSAPKRTSIFEKDEACARRSPWTETSRDFRPGNSAGARAFAAKRTAKFRRDGSRRLLPAYPPARLPRRPLHVRLLI